MDPCQKIHHKQNSIIGICIGCKDNYLSCKDCFAEIHYKHSEDFIFIDNILLILDQVLQKLDEAKDKLKSQKLQQLDNFIKSKYSSIQLIRTQFINQNINLNLLNNSKLNFVDDTLNEILCQLIVQSQGQNQQEIENIRQIFIQQFQQIQIDHLIIQMFDRCQLLYSIQKYKEANVLTQTLLKLTNKQYFLTQNLQELNQIPDLQSNQNIWNQQYLLGRNLYLIKEYNKSIDFFKKLCKPETNEKIIAESQIYLSLNLMLLKRYPEALDQLQIYRTLNPSNLLINFFEGFTLEQTNQLQEAIQKYQELALITNDLLYNLAYGKILFQSQHYNQAEEIFENIIQNHNQNEIAQIYKCLILFKAYKIEQALKQSEMLINTRPKCIYGYIFKGTKDSKIIGMILKMQKKTQEVNYLSNQLNLSFPSNRWNYLFQSIMLMVDSQFLEAHKELQKITDDINIREYLKNIEVCCLLKMNKIPEAFEIIKEMKNYHNYNSMLSESFFLIRQNGMTTFGAIQYQKLFTHNPQDYEAKHFQGQCYYHELKYDQALNCYNEAININPKSAKSYYYKGQSLFRTYQFDQALDCYLKAIKYDSIFNNHNVSFHKGNLYLFLFEFEKALDAYNHGILIECATEQDAQRKQIISTMKAIIYWYNKETQKAIELVNQQESSFILSRLYQELHHDYQAQFHLKQFKQNNPEGTYNFQKKNYQHGQMYIKYMEKHSQQFEQLNDREYEILKYAAWYLDENAYDIEVGIQIWDYNRLLYLTINYEQNQKMINEQLKRIVKYPII